MIRILLANDDGIDAPGLALLEEAARRISEDVWVVAPSEKRTAAGNSLTIARPMTMVQAGERRYACSGNPADCVVTAMTWLFADDRRPDLILSGVNDGKNVGEDIAYSGTLGIAREETFWGVPAIALSRVKNPERAGSDAEYLAKLLSRLWDLRDQWVLDRHWLSVNLPARLPAPVGLAAIGRDKIAVSCEILRQAGDVTELVVPRGRQNSSGPGDENDLLTKGFATLNRLRWDGETGLPPGIFDTF